MEKFDFISKLLNLFGQYIVGIIKRCMEQKNEKKLYSRPNQLSSIDQFKTSNERKR